MKSHFSFKEVLKRMPNVSIPKEFKYFGIGAVLVILLGLIASNMYLQEMLFFEGVEKSVSFFTEEELGEYGEMYKDLSLDFQNEIGAYVQGYARRDNGNDKYFVNRAGERIYYGVFNHEHTIDDTGKIKQHNNGQNVNKADDGHMSDYDDSYNDFRCKWTYVDSDEFKNGINIKYSITEGREDGESNFQDILTIVSMLMDQKQSDDTYKVEENENNLKSKIPELIKSLYKMSHTYNGDISDLYPCNKGCRVLFYYCNEIDSDYLNTGIDLKPFEINSHEEFDDYSSEDFELVDSVGECEICGHNGKGCTLDSEKCWHGKEDRKTGCKHYLGQSPGACTHLISHYECPGHGSGENAYSCTGPIGCEGYWECGGHDHWNCPGHFYVCCMGHRDITLKIKIMYIDEMLKVIKNGYNVE